MDREELSKALNETVAGMPVVTGKTDATEKDDKPDFIGDDGLLHCGKCGKPKQMRLETPMRDTPVCCRHPLRMRATGNGGA